MLGRINAAVIAAGLLCVLSTASAQVESRVQSFPTPSAADRALLKDAIDIHSHLDPDSFGPHSSQAARSLDAIDMAKRAKKAGMRGFVIKQHYDQTAQIAYLVDKAVPGIEAFGQLCLNLTVGGLNVDAIYHFTEVKGGLARIVAMPTWDSANNVSKSKDPTRKSVAVSGNGELLPETKAVLAAIATVKDRDTGATLALSTGHVSATEALMVVREAKKLGIAQIVVTHAIGPPVNMTTAQMKEAAGMGAYIEFVAGMALGEHSAFSTQQYYDAIRAIGAEHVILSSDSGQLNRPAPDDTIAIVAGRLKAAGLTNAELHQIMVENPATLLGLPQVGKK
jgi:hypothetical protein